MHSALWETLSAFQVRPPLRGFVEPLESGASTEPFVVDPCSEEDEPAEEHAVGSLGLAKAAGEAPWTTEEPAGSHSPLPCEYKAQGLLSPTEEGPPGREGSGEEEVGRTPYEAATSGGGSLEQG